jgi:dephospho-CoA kinase
MIRAALTGGIATGKSYCLGRFASLGVPVIDADQLARDAVAPGTPGLRAVAERFGTHLIKPDGMLDRAALGGLVFSDRGARAALEAIIHPEVRQRIREWFAQLPHARLRTSASGSTAAPPRSKSSSRATKASSTR